MLNADTSVDQDYLRHQDGGSDEDTFTLHGDDPGAEQYDALRIIHTHRDLNRDTNRHEDGDEYEHSHPHSHLGIHDHPFQHWHGIGYRYHHPGTEHDT